MEDRILFFVKIKDNEKYLKEIKTIFKEEKEYIKFINRNFYFTRKKLCHPFYLKIGEYIFSPFEEDAEIFTSQTQANIVCFDLYELNDNPIEIQYVPFTFNKLELIDR